MSVDSESTPTPVSPPESVSSQRSDAYKEDQRSSAVSESSGQQQANVISSHMRVIRPQTRSKSKTKVFQCTGYDDCNMTFSRSEHLARHIRKHTGERPFVCFCGRSFSRLDNLRQHMYTVHAKETHVFQQNGANSLAPVSKPRRNNFEPSQAPPPAPSQQSQQPPPQPQSVQTSQQQQPPLPQQVQQPQQATAGQPPVGYPQIGTEVPVTQPGLSAGQKPLPPHPTMVMPYPMAQMTDNASAQYPNMGMMMMGAQPAMMGQPIVDYPAQPTALHPMPYAYTAAPGQSLVQMPIQAPITTASSVPQAAPLYFANQPQPQHMHTQVTPGLAGTTEASSANYAMWKSSLVPPDAQKSRPQSTESLNSVNSLAPPASPTSHLSAADSNSPWPHPRSSDLHNRQSSDRYSVSSIDSSVERLSVASGSSVRSSQTSLWLSSVLNESNESPTPQNVPVYDPDRNSLPAVSQLSPLSTENKPASRLKQDLLSKPLPKLPFEMKTEQ